MSLASMVVDFNSYFASVEQQEQPALRGRPVAVVPMMADTTCAIAASYEAKRFGVKTGTLVREARRMCPGLVLIEARHEVYVRYHLALIKAIDSCMHVEKVMSIDEVLCPLTGRWRERDEAIALAHRIKKAIATQVGEFLRCSIGIAPNPFLAKTASDMQKPDGLVVIEQGDLPHILHPLKLRDLCGIGENMEARLHAAGIRTMEELCAAPKLVLHGVWGGVQGSRFYEELRGNMVPRLETAHSSVGHSHVLAPEERTHASALAVLHRMLQKAAMRLRHMGYLAGALSVSLKHMNRTRWRDELQFTETDDTLDFTHALRAMWNRRPATDATPLAVGVNLFHLIERQQATPSLFPEAKDRTKLNRAVDALNQRFGRSSAYFAGAHGALKSAPMRIAFTHVPDLETESDGE
jgi:DNA polymerase-4